MLQFARYRSEELDNDGLVGLPSLPTAEPFYRKMGMIDDGTDPSQENMTYFEWYRRRPTMLEELGIELEPDE